MSEIIDATIKDEGSPVPTENLYIHALKFGAIIAAVGIVLQVLLYVVSPPFMVTFKFLLIILVLNIGLLIYGGILYRRTVGGYLEYGKSYLYVVTTMVVATVIGTIFSMLLYHVIDPELPQVLSDAAITNTEELMAKFGADQDAIDQGTARMKVDLAKQFSVGGQALTLLKTVLGAAVLGLLLALAIRKKPQVDY